MRGNILACRYKFPSDLLRRTSQHDLVVTFERAVARVILRHPHLHVGIVGETTTQPYWVRLNSVMLKKHIEWRLVEGDTDSLEQGILRTIYEQLDTKFSNHETAPGWRIIVLRPADADFIEVLLVFDHTNLDGSSAKTFHRDLLQSLQDDSRSKEEELVLNDHVLTLPESSTAIFCPPPEDVAQFPVAANFTPNEVDHSAIDRAKDPADAHWAPITTAPFKSQFRTIIVPPTLLSQLVQACRQHQVTLTCLFHALALVSLAPLLGPANASAFASMTAMDLRRFLPSHHPRYPWFKPEGAISNYVTILNHVFDEGLVSEIRSRATPFSSADSTYGKLVDLVWLAARRVRREITNKLEQGTTDDMIGFALAVNDWRAYLAESTQRPRPASWVITNLGVIDSSPDVTSFSDVRVDLPSAKIEPESSWSITRSQVVMCANVVSAAFGISMTAVQGGDLVINCTWQDCVISIMLGETFVANLERWLKCISMLAGRRLEAGLGHQL